MTTMIDRDYNELYSIIHIIKLDCMNTDERIHLLLRIIAHSIDAIVREADEKGAGVTASAIIHNQEDDGKVEKFSLYTSSTDKTTAINGIGGAGMYTHKERK